MLSVPTAGVTSSARSRRPRIGVVLTAPNSVLESDLWHLGSEWASWHSSRTPVHGAAAGEVADSDVESAIDRLGPVDPHLIVVGLSTAPFKQGGLDGHRRWKRMFERHAGVPIVTLADGIEAALRGTCSVGLLTPLNAASNEPIERFLSELGIHVTNSIGLSCADVRAIADLDADTLMDAVRTLDSPEAEAIVQIGTNMDFVGVAASATAELGKPVHAANAAIAYAALSSAEIPEPTTGGGGQWP